MQKFLRLVLLWVATLSACSAIPTASQSVSPVSPSATFTNPTATNLSTLPATTESLSPLPTTAVPDSNPLPTLGTPHIDQGPDGAVTAPPDAQNCGYQWAYQDLPELSSRLKQSLQALQPEAQVRAFAFGENCILPDGSVGHFLAMETDFNITLQVADLNSETELGEWVVNVMQVILEIPPEQIVGTRPGRVSLTFRSAGEERHLTFYINQYQELPPGLSPVEILQQLQTPQ